MIVILAPSLGSTATFVEDGYSFVSLSFFSISLILLLNMFNIYVTRSNGPACYQILCSSFCISLFFSALLPHYPAILGQNFVPKCPLSPFVCCVLCFRYLLFYVYVFLVYCALCFM